MERQAENVASRVVQRQCDACEEEDAKGKVHRHADAGAEGSGADSAGPAVSSVLDSGSGQPLDSATRGYFEPRFSRSFADVRVHTGAVASESARSIHARAYTSGTDIVFRDGEFAPGSASGRQLLAHELTHVVQQRSSDGEVVARQVDAGVPDEPLPGPSPQPRPTPLLTTGLDAGFIDDPNAPPAGADAMVFAGIQLSSDEAFVTHQLTRFIEAHDRLDKGVDETRVALRRLANEIARGRGDLSSMHGVTPERERISDWVPRAERILPVAQKALAGIEEGHTVFLRVFAAHAALMTAGMLDMSLERVESEAQRYGVGVTAHTKTRRYKEADGPWTEQQSTTLSYHMAQNSATSGLALAAAALADRLRTVKQLVEQRNALYEYHDIVAPNGMHVSTDVTISDQKKYDELTGQIADARGKYEVLRFEKERDYPILAAYTPYDASLGALPLAQTVRGLDALGKGPSGPAVAHTLHKEIDDRRRDIQTTWDNLDRGKLDIWKLPPVLAATEAAMGVEAGSVRDRLVQEHVDAIGSKDQAIAIALSVLALALGLLAAIPSGGSSLVAAGTFVAGVGAASIGVYFAAEHLDQYMLESAASGTDFDRKARAVSNSDPSLFWLAVDILSAIADVFVAAKAFKELMKPVRAALNARRLGKAGAEIAQEKLDDIVRAAENNGVKELGEKVRDSILHQPGRTGTDADRALMQWESAINTESRASLVDNAPLRATYSEMSEGTRNVLTWCASNCLIPTANKTQVKKVDKLLANLPKGGDDSSMRMYLHAYADDLDTALENLKGVKSWEEVDELMRLEAFGGAGNTKALTTKEIDEAMDEMFSPRVTGGQEPRVGGHRVAVKKRTRLDIQDIPRKAGEKARQAYQRVKGVIYKQLSEIDAVEKAWNRARAHVEKTHGKLTKDNYGELYDLTRNRFWKEVRGNPAAKKHFTDAGFMFPDGETTAPLLANTSGSLRKTEIRVSLDHLAEKAIGDNWKKALDADNLQMEFAMPNTYREIIQSRHPELRALTE